MGRGGLADCGAARKLSALNAKNFFTTELTEKERGEGEGVILLLIWVGVWEGWFSRQHWINYTVGGRTMNHRLYSIVSVLVIFCLIMPVGGMAAGAQTQNDEVEAQAIEEGYKIGLPMVQRAFKDVPPVLADTAIELTEESTSQISSVSEDGSVLTFDTTTAELAQVNAGDTIIGGVSEATPYGFLRKVSTVQELNGDLVVSTEPATIEDAYEQLSINVEQVITPENLQSFTDIPGVTMIQSSDGVNAINFEFELSNVILYDQDGDTNTIADQIVLNGFLSFSPTYAYRLFVDNFTVEDFYFTQTMSAYSELTVTSRISLVIQPPEINLLPPPPLILGIFPIPGTPIVLTPSLQLVAGVNGRVYADITTSITRSASFTSGLQYFNNTWEPIAYYNSDFTFEVPSLNWGISFTAYVGPKINLNINGIVNVYVKANLALKVDIEPTSDPWLTLEGGLIVPVGVSVGLFKFVLADIHFTAIDYWWLLYSVPNQGNAQLTIPAGEFEMGCDPLHNGDYTCYADEIPIHSVYLDAYSIDATEVTNAEYSQCVAAGACTAPVAIFSNTRTWYYGNPEYETYPVIFVSWTQANAYCTWTGGHLPTEAQWEKAARGSSDARIFPWGDQSPDCTLANFEPSTACVGDTSPIGSYSAGISPYDLYDMSGNVWEWVSDWYSSTYYTDSPYENPTGPTSGTVKIVRGGGWGHDAGTIRVANRHNVSSSPTDLYGFRCAYTP